MRGGPGRALSLVLVVCALLVGAHAARAQSATDLFEQAYDARSKGDNARAERLYRDGLNSGGAPQNLAGLAHYYLAEILIEQQKSRDEAVRHYQQAARLIPQSPEGADALAKAQRLGVAAPLPPAPANPSLPPSTFQLSCTDIQYAAVNGNPAVRARCRRINQTVKTSTLVVRGVSNENGQLVQGLGPSSFHRSCDRIAVTRQGKAVVLSARCRMVNGEVVEATLPLQGIENINGDLQY